MFGIFKNRGKKNFYKGLINKIQRSIWDMELRIITIKEIREGIRREFDRTSGVVKELETKISEEKDPQQKKKLENTQTDYKHDIDALREQMMGKWSESKVRYEGGIDQEINTVEEKIQGAREFQGLIKQQLRRLKWER